MTIRDAETEREVGFVTSIYDDARDVGWIHPTENRIVDVGSFSSKSHPGTEFVARELMAYDLEVYSETVGKEHTKKLGVCTCESGGFCAECAGLFCCEVCGGAEGSLTAECCNFMLCPAELDLVHARILDFVNFRWKYNLDKTLGEIFDNTRTS